MVVCGGDGASKHAQDRKGFAALRMGSALGGGAGEGITGLTWIYYPGHEGV